MKSFLLAITMLVSVAGFAEDNFLLRKKSDLPKGGAGSYQGPCKEKKNSCEKGQECVLIEVHCAVAPCPPVRECVLSK